MQFDPQSKWVTADYRAGDVVVLTTKTLHGSLHNVTADRMRFSCDVRFQPAAHPIDGRWVGQGPSQSGHGGNPLEIVRTIEEARLAWLGAEVPDGWDKGEPIHNHQPRL